MTHRTAAAAALFAVAAVVPVNAHAQDPDSTRVIAPGDTLVAGAEAVDSIAPPSPGRLTPEMLVHLDHLAAAFTDTPMGMSLLQTGLVEAEVAAAWVRVAGMDSVGLGRMRSAMSNVLHALDPTETGGSGAALGYGVRRAAEGVAMHMELAMAADSLPSSLAFHGPFIVRAAAGAQDRIDDAIAIARQVQTAPDEQQALRLLNRLADAVRAVAWGDDRDGDGRVGHVDAEVGLAQAAYHLGLVYRMGGLTMPDVHPGPVADSLGLDQLGRRAPGDTGR